MVSKRSRRNNGASTYTKSQRAKQKRYQHFNKSPAHARRVTIEGWNERLNLRANYRNLGIAADSNDVLVAPKLAVLNPEAQLLPSKTGILTDRLNYLRSLPPPQPYEVKSMNVQEQYQLQNLIAKYADDYEGMQMDPTLNVTQQTAHQLQKRIELMFRLQNISNNYSMHQDSDMDEDYDEDEEEEEEEKIIKPKAKQTKKPTTKRREVISLPNDEGILQEDHDIVAKLNQALESVPASIVVPRLSKLPRYKRSKPKTE